MTDLYDAAGAARAAASTRSGRDLSLPGWSGRLDGERFERDHVMSQGAEPTPGVSCSAASRAGLRRSST
jgi:hypothetical protein